MKITEKRVKEALHFKSPLHPYTTIAVISLVAGTRWTRVLQNYLPPQ